MNTNFTPHKPAWQNELNKTAYKYHVLVAWVAVILNPVWAVGDYYTIPVHFNDFLVFRLSVTVAILVGIIFRKKLSNRPEIIAFIPFIGISIQNAFMYSVMNVTELEKHTFAYIALFIGAGMFVLWKPMYSIIIVVLSFIANIIFFHFNSSLQLGEILINGAMLTASVAIFTILLINTRTNLTKKEIVSRLALAETNKQLAIQKNIIEEKNKDVQDSIRYALRIQHAILPHNDKIEKVFDDYFIFYRPKDIIAGDFYWLENIRVHSGEIEVVNTISKQQEHLVTETELVIFAAADCTGHGVPGAMVSVVCSNALNRAAKEFEISDPGKILDKARELVVESFENSESKVQDGMDISLCVLNKETKSLQWAGANNPLWIVRDGKVIVYKANKQPIGAYTDMTPFTTHNIPLQKGDCLYLFTDGFQDQFGGGTVKKFMKSNLKNTLLSLNHLDMKTQKERLNKVFDEWKGNLDQVDDVCVMGFRI